jgi:hypothetical protein
MARAATRREVRSRSTARVRSLATLLGSTLDAPASGTVPAPFAGRIATIGADARPACMLRRRDHELISILRQTL